MGLSAETKAAFPFLFGDWAPMGLREWGLMALLGVLSAAYFVGVARAYQIAAPSIIGPSTTPIWCQPPFGALSLRAETPDLLTIAGMILITMAGLLVALRPAGKAKGETTPKH